MWSKEELTKQVVEVLSNTQEMDCEVNEQYISTLIDTWAENKKWLLDMFNNGLIIEMPDVSAALNKDRYDANTSHFLFWAQDYDSHLRAVFANTEGYSDEVYAFLCRQKAGLLQNCVTCITEVEDKNNICYGMKITKALKHFISNEDILKEYQNKLSYYIQSNTVKGTLCLSIHPLDYLTMSVNNHKWRSCHALDGEYRAGDLSYMCDKTTFIAYLKSEEDTHLNDAGIKWNNKKWRVMLYGNPNSNIIFAGKQYPFNSAELMNQTLELFETVSHWCIFKGWSTDYVTSDTFNKPVRRKYCLIREEIYPLDEIVKDNDQRLHYNDILHSSTMFDSPYFYGSRGCSPVDESLEIGWNILCIHCGQEDIADGNSTMLCHNCEINYGTEVNGSYNYCDVCGGRFHVDDLLNIDDGDTSVCEHCYYNNCITCVECGEVVSEERAYYDEETGNYYCWRCSEG